MALPYPISPGQTAAKAPVDQNLMDSIRLDLDYLDQQITGGSVLFQFNVNGNLRHVANYSGALDTAVAFGAFFPATCRAVLKQSGLSGKLKFDLRKIAKPKTPIIGIAHKFSGQIQSIGRIAGTVATQSIQRTVPQIATQSISYFKDPLNIQSVLSLGGNYFRYNFAGPILDSDYQKGLRVLIDSANDPLNDGDFEIVEVNQSGFPSIVVYNPTGVQDITAAGTVNLHLYEYSFLNPVDSDFVPGEFFLSQGHTHAGNNGSLQIYKVNDSGNNIVVYNVNGAEQATVTGSADAERWVVSLLAPADNNVYAIGEMALMSAHTNANNNGNKVIVDLNRAGNNFIVYNPGGVVQAGAVGTSLTNRFSYFLNSDPDTLLFPGERASIEGASNANNNGIFDVVLINYLTTQNVVVYNPDGVAQGTPGGVLNHTHKLIRFAQDESATFIPGESIVELMGTQSALYWYTEKKKRFEVLDVNFLGGANYNIVIEGHDFPSQSAPGGFVQTEMQSLFSVKPEIDVDLVGNTAEKYLIRSFTNFKPGQLAPNTPVCLFLESVPLGAPQDLTVILS